jgi:hypothetical protein
MAYSADHTPTWAIDENSPRWDLGMATAFFFSNMIGLAMRVCEIHDYLSQYSPLHFIWGTLYLCLLIASIFVVCKYLLTNE